MLAWMFARLWVVLALAGCGGDAASKNLYAGGCALDLEDPSTRAQLIQEMWQQSRARDDLKAIAAAPVRERGAVVAALRRAGLESCQDRDLAAIEQPTYFGVELAVISSTHLPIGEVDKLVEIRDRRWPKGDRTEIDRQIILQLDEDVPAQRLFEVAAAVEKDPAGNARFPELILSSGFR